MEYAIFGWGLVAFSDWMDGSIAKRYHPKTILGTFLDPIADKWIIAVLSTALAYKGVLPIPLVGLWLLRNSLLIGYTYSYMKH
jgi:cardiolipin synthase